MKAPGEHEKRIRRKSTARTARQKRITAPPTESEQEATYARDVADQEAIDRAVKMSVAAPKKSNKRPGSVNTIQEARILASITEELCEKLVRKFAEQSTRFSGDGVDSTWIVRMRYTEIVQELRCVRHTPPKRLTRVEREKLQSAIFVATAANDDRAIADAFGAYISALSGRAQHPSLWSKLSSSLGDRRSQQRFLLKLDGIIKRYLLARWRNESSKSQIDGVELGSSLMMLLAEEWLRDSAGLRRLFSAIFAKWLTIDKPDSSWRYKTVIAHIAPGYPGSVRQGRSGNRKDILDYLEKVGVVPPSKGNAQIESELRRIGKRISRDFGKALSSSPEPFE